MILTTPSLQLRPVIEEDYPAVRAMVTDAETQRYESEDLSEEHALEFFQVLLKDCYQPERSRQRWAITMPPGNTALGIVHVLILNEQIKEYEIGWHVRREHWGKGFATEAARAVLHYAFNDLRAHRVVAFCHAQNAASERVMRKLGMQCDGLLRQTRWLHGAWHDELVYAILDCDPR